ncbi:MAG: hypothetical protein Kow0092_28770 [Deferrisomatales bacterium]
MSSRYGFLAVVVTLLSFQLSAAGARTITVDDDGPADAPTISRGLALADPGDTVLVKEGTYVDNVILVNHVDVIGAGPDVTTILPRADQAVVLADDVLGATLSGFTVSGGGRVDTCIDIYGGSPVISNNIVSNCKRRGISIVNASSAIVTGNIVTMNGRTDNGFTDYGIIILHSTPFLANNLILDQPEVGVYVGWEDSEGTQFINNTVVNNRYDGIWCYRSSPTVKNNIFTGNGFGIAASHGAAAPKISYNDVWGNGDDYNSQSGGVAAPGPGDISADPMFADAGSGDYHLSEGSPCIDAGDPNPAYDDLDGTRNDMGAYGGIGGGVGTIPSPIKTGFVFTSVGKIPVSEITQAGVSTGLANVSPEVAGDLSIPRYHDSPFGGNLWLHGQFGAADSNVVYYRILAAKWTGGSPPSATDFEPLTDPLTKVKYEIQSDGTVKAKRVLVGPLPSAPVEGLYMRTHTGYWAHPDLKMIWHTGANGKVDLTYEAYDAAFHPISLLPNTQDRITLHIDNSPVHAQIHSIMYDSGVPITRCEIIQLGSALENLKFNISATHPNGFLRLYRLDVLFGENEDAGYIVRDQYTGSNDSSPPQWFGVSATTFNSADSPMLDPWETCAYQFRLRVWGRATDGFNYRGYDEYNSHHQLQVGADTHCTADLDGDGDIDGSDLELFGRQYGEYLLP